MELCPEDHGWWGTQSAPKNYHSNILTPLEEHILQSAQYNHLLRHHSHLAAHSQNTQSDVRQSADTAWVAISWCRRVWAWHFGFGVACAAFGVLS